jgi:uncharacterized membrane protein
MAMTGEQEFSTEIEASITQCFNTLVDFPAYPQWSSPIQSTRVLERHANKLARLVEFELDMKLRTVRYVLEYDYDKPTKLTWESRDGDVESIEGSYTLEKLTPKTTRVTCRQRIALGFWVPGPIRSMIERSALKQSVLELKAEVEKRGKKA